MKRKISIIADNGRERVEIRAVIRTRRPFVKNEHGTRKREGLARDEVGQMRDVLADELMRSIGRVPYLAVALSRIKIK